MAEPNLKDDPASDKRVTIFMPWRMGRKLGRTIYAQISEEESDNDILVGIMDSRILAADVVASHNAVLASRPAIPSAYSEAINSMREDPSKPLYPIETEPGI